MNLRVRDFIVEDAFFDSECNIEIELNAKRNIFEKAYKTNPGSIKRKKNRKVHPHFTSMLLKYYENHLAYLTAKGYKTDPDSPLFLNNYGNPMTVAAYSSRVKKLFYKKFMPSLETYTMQFGLYKENKAYIERYREEYPGAHMFRHWFSMFLFTELNVTDLNKLMQYRGDSSITSVSDYLTINNAMKERYKLQIYRFQQYMLDEINKTYRDKWVNG